jgi:ATP-dependent protease ClpP protease subunit
MNRKKGNALEAGKILKAEGEEIYEDTTTMMIHPPLKGTVSTAGVTKQLR